MKKIIAVINKGKGTDGCNICQSMFKQSCEDIKILYGNKDYSCSYSHTHFELIEEDNKMPELKAGMVVKLQGSDTYLLVMPKPGYDDCLVLLNSKGTIYLDSCMKSISEVYHMNRNQGYYNFFNGDPHRLLLTLVWTKEPDYSAKVAELQEVLNKLDKEHTESVEEIREQLRRLK